VALVEGNPPLSTVVAANDPALLAGIEIGMGRALAEQFPAVQIRERSNVQEKTTHAALLDLAWSISPRVEDTGTDTIAIDLAGLSSLFGSEHQIAHQLAKSISTIGLSPQIAVSSNLETAIHAAHGFRGITLIPPGEEAKQLGKLPIQALGASMEVLETLALWGVHTCEALAALPILQLSERLGQEGVRLHQWARGEGVRPILLAEPGSVFEEELELEDPVEELDPLSFLLARLLGQLCTRLAARSLAICAIHLRLELDPCGRQDLQIRNGELQRSNRVNAYGKTLTLPVPMRDSKVLLNLLRLQLQADPPAAPILKIAMAAEPARPRATQTGLFLPPSPVAEKLELTIARLARLVGEANLGSPELVDTHRPGEFRMERFLPAQEETQKRGKARKTTSAIEPTNAGMGFRMFRPALPASVRVRGGQPHGVIFRGIHGEVIATSGPWRTSGDWWREDAWHQDEWDLQIRFEVSPKQQDKNPASCPQHGVYRFYFDSIQQGWFVQGIYD
jgi:protein ImuB